jgi:glutamine cyclotransferase
MTTWMPRRSLLAAGMLLFLTVQCACSPQAPTAARPAIYGYLIERTYPHDTSAFTEGLLYQGGFLYESTGLYEQSSIRKVNLETGKVEMFRNLPGQYFGEGIAVSGDRLLQLTWTSGKGFVYDLATFEPRGEFAYSGEGWSLTSDGKRVIMSDGTAELRFLDSAGLRETGRLQVTDDGRPVKRLNELEWVKGEIFANVWHTERIARIDPATGHVTGWIDLSGLETAAQRTDAENVLNGIAYDAAGDRLFVTGKRWPKLFQIRVVVR